MPSVVPPLPGAPLMRVVPVREGNARATAAFVWSTWNRLLAGGVVAGIFLFGLLSGVTFRFAKSPTPILPLAKESIEIASIKVPAAEQAHPTGFPPSVKPQAKSTEPLLPLVVEPVSVATVVPAPAKPALQTNPDEAFADLEKRGFCLELPKSATESISQVAGGDLCRIRVTDVKDCRLELIGAELAFGEKKIVTLDLDYQPNEFVQTWSLNYAATVGLVNARKKPFARLGLSQQSGILRFDWEPAPTMPPGVKDEVGALNFCLLKVDVGNRSEICQFFKTRTTPPITLTSRESTQAIAGSSQNSFAQNSGQLRIEFAENDASAAVPLMNTGDVIGVSTANPFLKVTFVPSDPTQIPASSELPAPRKGVRFDLSTDKIPCFVDLELRDLPNGIGTTLGVKASLLVQGYRYDLKPQLVRVDAPEPFSHAAYRQTIAVIEKKVSQHRAELTMLTNELDVPTREISILQGIVDNPPKSFDPLTAQANQARLVAAKADLVRAKQKLKAIQDKNKKLPFLEQFVSDAPEILKQYQEIASRLGQFQNSLQFDYKVHLTYPERSILLLKSAQATTPKLQLR